MKKLLTILSCVFMCFFVTVCGNKNNYSSKISFPKEIATCEYYSYGYHWSTVTISDYSYEISEQSETQIRIDFNFECSVDYLGDNDAGTSFCFYIIVYDKERNIINENIVSEISAKVGYTVTTKHTVLLNKEDVNEGVVIEFRGNN